MEQPDIGEFLQLQARSYIDLDLQHRQWLEKLLFDLPLDRFRQTDDKRKSTVFPGEHINDKSRLTMLN
jgi:hypothetical protein